ncbi:MAG TPA: dienelactone hydrolase family protein [Jiangellaceae bacterium]|nr:dienelactone hydrolase family protein [Jiangellaceae bacterium]
MAYGDVALPPEPPAAGALGDHGELFLLSADGTEFGAYYAYPQSRRARSAVVVMPDERGLHRFYQELANRFATAGLLAIGIDYYGRTTQLGSPRGESFPFHQHADQLRSEQVTQDVHAATLWLRNDPAHNVNAVFSVGFGSGATLSLRQSAADHGLAGCVGFYGRPDLVSSEIGSLRAPMLVLAAGQDSTPVDEIERFAEQVRDQGVEAELHVYPDAPPSFFDRADAEYPQECDDAWRRVLAFIDRHGG